MLTPGAPDIDAALTMDVEGSPGWRMVADLDDVPLTAAVRGGDAAAVEALIAAGADARVVDGYLRHLLFLARDADVARALVAAGVPFERVSRRGETALSDAIAEGDLARAAALLAAGADPAHRVGGRTMLMLAAGAIDRTLPMLQLLVEHGADPHAVSDHGWNALDCAVDTNGSRPAVTRAVLDYLVSLGVADLRNNRYASALEREIIDEARARFRRARR